MTTLLSSFSAKAVSVERATGDCVVANSFSAKAVDMLHAIGDSKIIRYLSTAKAGYSINGTEIAVPDYTTHITREK